MADSVREREFLGQGLAWPLQELWAISGCQIKSIPLWLEVQREFDRHSSPLS